MFRFIWWTHTSCEHVHISIDLKIYCFISCSVKEQRTNCALDSSQLWFLKDYFSKYLVHLKPHILYFPVDAALFEWTCDFFSIVLALCYCDTCESGIGHWTIFFCSKRATEQYTNLSRTETSPQDFYWRRNMNLELLGNVKLFIWRKDCM